jgi:WD40 repeat protein
VTGTVYGNPMSGVLDVQFEPDGRVVTIGRDHVIHTFTPDGKPQSATPPFRPLLTKLAIAWDDKSVAAGDYNGGVFLWNGKESEAISSAPAH